MVRRCPFSTILHHITSSRRMPVYVRVLKKTVKSHSHKKGVKVHWSPDRCVT